MAGRLSSPAIRKTGPVNMDQTPNINRSIIGTTIGSIGTLKSKLLDLRVLKGKLSMLL